MQRLLKVNYAFIPLLDVLFKLFQQLFELTHRHLLVDLRLILNLFGPLTESERGYGLSLVEARGTARDDETCLRVATEGLLQHARELAVTVGDVRGLAVGERVDHQPQRCQTLVDVLGLVQRLP